MFSYTVGMPDAVAELLIPDSVLDKLGARGISPADTGQLLRNAHVTVRNPRRTKADTRRLLIGNTDAGRTLTLVIEQTVDPTTWLVVTGWGSTDAERKILPR